MKRSSSCAASSRKWLPGRRPRSLRRRPLAFGWSRATASSSSRRRPLPEARGKSVGLTSSTGPFPHRTSSRSPTTRATSRCSRPRPGFSWRGRMRVLRRRSKRGSRRSIRETVRSVSWASRSPRSRGMAANSSSRPMPRGRRTRAGGSPPTRPRRSSRRDTPPLPVTGPTRSGRARVSVAPGRAAR